MNYKKYILIMILVVVFSLLIGCVAKDNEEDLGVNEIELREFEVTEDTFNTANLQDGDLQEVFSFEESLYRVDQVREGLESFRKLTEQGRAKLLHDVLDQVGNTEWEIQVLGFQNWPNTIEGTLRMQDYRVKRLEYELAVEKYKQGEVIEEFVEETQAIYNDAKNELQEYLDSYAIAD